MELAISFGELLRRFRKYNDYTQAEAAKRLGYSVETIKSWEQGRRFPAHEEAARLADLMELDAQEVKRAIKVGRSRLYDKGPSTDSNFPKGGEKFYLHNTSVSISSIEEAPLDFTTRFGLLLGQLITLVNQWDKLTTTYCELQQIIHEGISMFDEIEKQSTEEIYSFSRRQAITVIAMLPVSLLNSLQQTPQSIVIPEELLPQCAASITACWHFMNGKQFALVEQVLSTYLSTIELLAQQYSRYQKAAASLASA